MGPYRPDACPTDSITPRMLLSRANSGLRELRLALATDNSELSTYLAEWSESVKPMQLEHVPHELVDLPLNVEESFLDHQRFAARLPTYKLPWLNRMPPQRVNDELGCKDYQPRGVGDLLLPEALEKMTRWFAQAKEDLDCLEQLGPECDRKQKPQILAIGQEEFQWCARGIVWDCRAADSCTPLDYTAPTSSKLDLDYLRRQFTDYPDQRLASNILEGVRLEADVEL